MVGLSSDVGDGVVGEVVVAVVVAVRVVLSRVGLRTISNAVSRCCPSTNSATVVGAIQSPVIERPTLETRVSRRGVTGVRGSTSSGSSRERRRGTISDIRKGLNGIVTRA